MMGINLEHAGRSIIDHCYFTDAIQAIVVSNTYNIESFTNNNITVPPSMGGFNTGFLIVKSLGSTIYKNHFFLYNLNPCLENNSAIAIEEYANSEEDNNNLPNNLNNNIIGNDFHDGCRHIISYSTLDPIQVYINDNDFFDAIKNIDYVNTNGTISDNSIINHSTDMGVNGCEPYNINLYWSSPDFLHNTIEGNFDNISSQSHSCPNLAPYKENNNYYWFAGKNNLLSYNINSNNNITSKNYNGRGRLYTDHGKNTFDIRNARYHIYAYLEQDCPFDFYTTCNYWFGHNGEPYLRLFGNDECTNINIIWQDPGNCDDNQIAGMIINDMGNNIFDTVFITQSNTNLFLTNDEILYTEAAKEQKLKSYSNSILNLKNLVDIYPNSKYLESAIYKLYQNYQSLDTNHNQNWRNIIFGDLKNYLEEKMQLYDTNSEFVDVAFNFYLSSAVKKKNYSLSLDGYDFIANYSPSAVERLLASIKYIDVEGLIQGNGGSEKDNSEQKMKSIKDILLKNYSKSKKLVKERENLELSKSKNKNKTKIEQDKSHQFDKKLENRAIENISISKSLTKEQRRERIRKDLMLLTQRESSKINIDDPKQLPINYSLSQNYPNPFNPLTKINYSIAKQGLVILKIYDILGREIKTLVNEVKTPGNYIVEFNGSEFSSGVYFYRIQAGNFSQVKKMVLIK